MKFERFGTALAGVLALLLLFASGGVAQSYRGRVQGVVTDQSQAVISRRDRTY